MTKNIQTQNAKDANFGYVFPVIRGVQARREYYTSMCPLRLIPKIFLFDEEEMPPELRAQRTLNKTRVPEMARYILTNKDGYVFSAITASIDGKCEFEAINGDGPKARVGLLHVPMDARFIINDGQHRRAAIEMALRDDPDVGDESIAVVFFLDQGLERSQQMFADLNRYAIRPNKSIGVLYDHRDDSARLTKLFVLKSPFFKDLVEFERSTLSARSRKLFTLSGIYHGSNALMEKVEIKDFDDALDTVTQFWTRLSECFPEWKAVRDRKITSGEVRQEFIHSHGVVLQALGVVGNALLRESRQNWKKQLGKLSDIDWSRSNTKIWAGRCIVGGTIMKGSQNVLLTACAIKKHLGLALGPEERRVEDAFRRSASGK